MNSIRDELLEEIEAFLAKHDMAPAKLGSLALNDPAFVLRLKGDRDIRIGTADRIREYMRNYKPKRDKAKRGTKKLPPSLALATG